MLNEDNNFCAYSQPERRQRSIYYSSTPKVHLYICYAARFIKIMFMFVQCALCCYYRKCGKITIGKLTNHFIKCIYVMGRYVCTYIPICEQKYFLN